MLPTLAEVLTKAKGCPIIYDGKNVVMSYSISVKKEQEVEVEFIHFDEMYQQGFEVSVDQRKGLVEVNAKKYISPVFWTNTAPKNFIFKCLTKKDNGIFNIWNVWKNIDFKNNIDSWIGNAGLYVEHIEKGIYVFHCSNGINKVNFNDLIFKVTIK